MADSKLSAFLRIHAEKLNLDEEVLKPIIEKADEIELPDELHSAVSDLMDVHGAKNNPDVAKKFKRQYLETIDKHSEKYLREFGFSDDELAEFLTESDSLKKHEITVKALKTKFESTSTGDVDAEAIKKQYADQINELQITLVGKDKAHEEQVMAIENQRKDDKFSWRVDQLTGGYTFTDAIPHEDAVHLIKTKLTSLPYTWRQNDSKEFVAYQGENGDLEVIENGNQLTLKNVVETNATPYIKKSDPKGDGEQGGGRGTTRVIVPNTSEDTDGRWMGNAGS